MSLAMSVVRKPLPGGEVFAGKLAALSKLKARGARVVGALTLCGFPLFRALFLLHSLRFLIVLHGDVGGGGEFHELLHVGKSDPRIFCGVVIQIGVKILFGQGFGGDAVFGDVHAGDPHDGAEDDFSEVVDCPVTVIVAAGEADAASAVLALDAPNQSLRLADAIDAVLVPEVDDAFETIRGRGRP